jgi:hypothetical protein
MVVQVGLTEICSWVKAAKKYFDEKKAQSTRQVLSCAVRRDGSLILFDRVRSLAADASGDVCVDVCAGEEGQNNDVVAFYRTGRDECK